MPPNSLMADLVNESGMMITGATDDADSVELRADYSGDHYV
jgi:hypothetical protein